MGRTTDGRLVVGGVYRFYETEGLPLDVLLEHLQDHQMIPDWQAFVREAILAGMRFDRVVSWLDAAIVDSFGVETRNQVIPRLRPV